MTKEQFAVICVVLVLVLAALALWAWRGRGKKQADIGDFGAVPEDFAPTFTTQVNYVATTRRDDPYDRVVVHGLAFRGTGSLAIGTDGVALHLHDRDVWVPRDDLEFVEQATWTIDRVVEPGGLIKIGALAETSHLDIYLRPLASGPAALHHLRELAATSTTFIADRDAVAEPAPTTTERSTSA